CGQTGGPETSGPETTVRGRARCREPAGADLGPAEDRRAHVPRPQQPAGHRAAVRALGEPGVGRPMMLRAGLHRRFTDRDGRAYVYVAASGAILALDPLSDELLAAFAGGPRPAAEVLRARADAAAALEDLVDLGVIRPADEATPPRAQLPPMPFPLATLV